MCGFAGFIDLRPNAPSQEHQQILSNMGRSLSLRGPDDEQRYDDTLALVFRRLSIVDLKTGQQPIWNEDHTLFIVVNGEIYNHKELRAHLTQKHQFRSRSDAEVVLHLYEERGAAALDLLIGMFAIAIWDTRQKRLFLARDRMGVKPLFFYRGASLLLFGSELKALLCHPECPREPRWVDIDATLHKTPTRRALASYLEGVEQLPGGHYAIFQDGEWELHRYWSIDDHFEGGQARTPAQYIDEYASLLEDSVQKRLMSDVPVGAFFSGGLDSSIIVSLASRGQRELHCFHALEKTVARCGDTSAAQSLAAHLKLPLHPILFDERTLLDELRFDLSSFEHLIWLFDAPRFHMEWLLKHEMHRYAKTLNPEMKVMLLGQGADEFAGGYSCAYGFETDWRGFEQNISFVLRQEMAESQRLSPSISGLLREPIVLSLQGQTRPLIHEEMRRRVGLLQNFNLWHEDRSSSGQGVEARVPFLDHRLIELLASIPAALHEELFWDKRIIRQAAKRWLPDELINRPKIGFFFTRDQSSIHSISVRLLQAIYPAFEEKYLYHSDSLFAQPKLRALYDRSLKGGAGAKSAIEQLFGCMAIEVFRSLCHSAPLDLTRRCAPPSPLREGDSMLIEQWANLEDESTPSLDTNDRVSLELDISVSLSLNDPQRLFFLRGEQLEREIEIDEEMAWVTSMIKMLQQRPHSAAEIASSINTSEEEVSQTLQYLMGLGLVQRSSA